jgi:ATP adenylyltransferase
MYSGINMNKLWAPWRDKYVTKILKESKGCIFCKILKEEKDKKNYIFIRTEHSYAVLNIYPYNNGHVLIVSNRHVNDLSKLKKHEREDLLDLLETTKFLLDKVLKPGGYNIGINLQRAAGAGFPGHLHVHLVPRWQGDVNFMPVTGDTKVISQSLKSVYQKLYHAYKRRY